MSEHIQEKELDIDAYQSKFRKGDRPNAIDWAIQTREFEIKLYWQRTTYFSVIVGALFIGYYTLLAEGKLDHPKKLLVLSAISGLGVLFSLAWYLANRGSKFWQENWEHHVDLLEQTLGGGPLFHTVLRRPIPSGTANRLGAAFIGPARYSVSAINVLVSLIILTAWVTIWITGIFTFFLCETSAICTLSAALICPIIFVTVAGFCLLLWKGKSTDLTYRMYRIPSHNGEELRHSDLSKPRKQ